MRWLHALGHALAISGSMTWEILWALILGFALSAVVRRSTITRRLVDDRPKTLAFATGFGAASSSSSSSSCSPPSLPLLLFTSSTPLPSP